MKEGIVNIRGKEYETVAHRIYRFRTDERFEGWRIITGVIENTDDRVVMEASIIVGDKVVANGHAEEYRTASTINRTSALENCETSAIGRALACLGIGGTEFASADEVQRAREIQKELKGALKSLQEQARLGTDALQDAWGSAGKDVRVALKDELEALKATAYQAEQNMGAQSEAEIS